MGSLVVVIEASSTTLNVLLVGGPGVNPQGAVPLMVAVTVPDPQRSGLNGKDVPEPVEGVESTPVTSQEMLVVGGVDRFVTIAPVAQNTVHSWAGTMLVGSVEAVMVWPLQMVNPAAVFVEQGAVSWTGVRLALEVLQP